MPSLVWDGHSCPSPLILSLILILFGFSLDVGPATGSNVHFDLLTATTAVRLLPTLFNSKSPFISSGPARFRS